MLQNWLQPVQLNRFTIKAHQLGKNIDIFDQTFPDLTAASIVIVGIEETEANVIRQSLYKMTYAFPALQIADIGNLRKRDISFIIPLIKELLDSDIFVVLIGKNPIHANAQFQGYQGFQRLLNMVVVDEQIPYSWHFEESEDDYLNDILKSKKPKLVHLGLLGFQKHFANPEVWQALIKSNFDCVRLGGMKTQLEETEPIIRDADLFCFNVNALKQTEAPGQKNPSPSGLSSEEACQLSRYAGMSDKLTSIGFYGYIKSKDRNKQTAQIIAQLIWYFFDGYYHRQNDFPVSTKELVEYIVDFKESEFQATFWKSPKSSRWWMQIPAKNQKGDYQRHYLVPCSYKDYLQACHEDLPNRLMIAYNRFS